MDKLALLTSVLSAIVGAGVGAVTVFVALRKDKREAHKAEDDEADRTIELLKEQKQLLQEAVAELKAQAEKREAEWQERRQEWQRRERKMESRIENLEQWRLDEISARSQLQMCRNAPDCDNYDPGLAPGGTD
jgi:peptidoglycan hydrolase CwlO-like protein